MFYPACEYAQTTVIAAAGTLTFKATGRTILSKGWRAVYGKDLLGSEDDRGTSSSVLPKFTVGESGHHIPSADRKMTTPPKHFTEATLLQAMETAGKLVDDEKLREAMKDNGIGRPSSRASIIETLIKRGYVQRDKKSLVSLPAGRNLIRVIQDPLLKSPELTGQWEYKLREIEHGRYTLDQFMEQLQSHLVTIIKDVKKYP